MRILYFTRLLGYGGLCLKVQMGVRETVCGGARQDSLCCAKDCYTESLFASVVGGNVCVGRLDKFKCTSVTRVKELHLKIFPVHGVRRWCSLGVAETSHRSHFLFTLVIFPMLG